MKTRDAMKTPSQLLATLHAPRSTLHAFSLLEVMVAVTLSAIIMIAAAGLWISCTRGWSFADQREKTLEEDGLVAQRIRELFQRALIESSSRDVYEWKCENNFDGRFSSDKIRFTTQWPVELEEGKTILVPVRGELGIRTEFRGGGKPNAVKSLTWRFAPFTSNFKERDDTETLVLSKQIESLNLRYWWAQAAQWVDDWREEKAWPEAVEVELKFAGNEGAGPRAMKFRIAIAPPQAIENANQNPEDNPEPGPENENPT